LHHRDHRDRFGTELDELFADLCHVGRRAGARRAFRPRVDVYRTDEPPAFAVVAELAGIDPADVDVTVAEGALVLSGARRRTSAGGAVYHHIELDYGPFERRIPLGERVDEEAIEAVYDRGLLHVTLPLASAGARKVRVAVTRRRAR
jgi:HSP20 family protein